MPDAPARPGEQRLPFDPAERTEAGVVFIGRIRSPWSRGDCPKNIRIARETGKPARVELDPAYAPGLANLSPGQPVMLLYWMAGARRDLIVQSPAHADGPRGVFALRSPARPNPIALSAVTIRSVDAERGVLEIDAIDCFDGTPLIDIKPWLSTVDKPAEAQ
ncbi:MAG: SAM-dependent methyltransferase [Pseudomonadota bacterium]